MAKWGKRLLGAGILAGAVYAVWRVLDDHARNSPVQWEAQPFPLPPKPVLADAPGPGPGATGPDPRPDGDAAPWVEPDGDHCPASHPVKAKLSSGIYHPPGGQMYDRTLPDRCYRDPAAAETDGLRASKR